MIGVSPQGEAQQPDQLPTSPRSSAWNVLEFWAFARSGSISLGATSVIPAGLSGLKRCCEILLLQGPWDNRQAVNNGQILFVCESCRSPSGTIGVCQILAPEESIEPPLEIA
ncbi:predicted protein [Histoplasma capsulatum G186AR]|uniref:Uncharacterized protein n=1 Tax=Ajellomyces capsulatus (strain G186AR / H82 / ATCC MYA-2454 / RMSCC 2432) TaxID=447093 RepID=C0NES1_AJECG|nr:uncharacterized protein HCBG_01387 [Histoplasma capsulatum G186AR]EEH09742.1 predicted protein [Histoplasma capsulatum G186AR]